MVCEAKIIGWVERWELVSVMSHYLAWRNPFGVLGGSCHVAGFSLNTIGNPFWESWLFRH